MEWCSHMDTDNFDQRLLNCVQQDFKFCPYCSAKRPEQPKKLWEKLSDIDGDTPNYFPSLAKEALKHFEEIVEKQNNGVGEGYVWITKEKLLKAMRESV